MATIKLNLEAFNTAAQEMGFSSDAQLARALGISTTQLWRVRLAETDPRHNDPGQDFIAGTLRVFWHKRFEDLFIVSNVL